ncbi:hypothetical protein L7F22_030284 [Adiantum nelumboides]|nr:hypothetical protein [Adiantum nelumboides]
MVVAESQESLSPLEQVHVEGNQMSGMGKQIRGRLWHAAVLGRKSSLWQGVWSSTSGAMLGPCHLTKRPAKPCPVDQRSPQGRACLGLGEASIEQKATGKALAEKGQRGASQRTGHARSWSLNCFAS